MTRTVRSAALATLAALAALAAILAADFPAPASAQSEDETTGRIVARRLATGRVEFGWQPPSGERVLPKSRYFPAPADATVDRWLRSSPVEVGGVELGRINARLRADGRIEFAFTPTDGERIAPPQRYFPASATVERGWLRSTEITFAPPAPRYIAVSAGGFHTCGLRDTGELECWGRNYAEGGTDQGPAILYYGQSDAPSGSFTAVSAGNFHTCGLRADSKQLECWGYNDNERASPPAGRFTAVSAGIWHTCGLRDDGAILCWGSNDAPDGEFRAVSAGSRHNCGLRTSGAIECWGSNDEGQSSPPSGSFTAVSAGNFHTCGLRTSGAIECWGSNNEGQSSPPAGSFTAVSAGWSYTCGLRESGAIECWGHNYAGRTEAPTGRFTAVSAGEGGHACAIRVISGLIECWGLNTWGQTGVPPN